MSHLLLLLYTSLSYCHWFISKGSDLEKDPTDLHLNVTVLNIAYVRHVQCIYVHICDQQVSAISWPFSMRTFDKSRGFWIQLRILFTALHRRACRHRRISSWQYIQQPQITHRCEGACFAYFIRVAQEILSSSGHFPAITWVTCSSRFGVWVSAFF